jgi:hypothetical protein
MNNLISGFLKGLAIFKNNVLIFLIICLVSSILAIDIAPNLLKDNLTEEAFNEQLADSSNPLITGVTFSYTDIMSSLLWIVQASIVSTALLVSSYVVKYIIDKRLFSFNRWRDWRFFLYISAIALIEIDVFQNIAGSLNLKYQTDLITNLIITVFYCSIIVVFSAMILPEEIPPIEMNIDKI